MEIMIRANSLAHIGRPLTPEEKKLTLWRTSDTFLHCCIESRGCQFSRKCGSCIMCDYGEGRNLHPDELRKELDERVSQYMNGLHTILIGTYGSIFDEDEISSACFDVILEFLAQYSIPTVIFETHCSTVNSNKLKKIRDKIPRKTKVIIEMGYESCDAYVLKYCLNKFISLEQLKNAIKLIHDYRMSACTNVLLGAPFLCERDQLDTAVKSVNWAFEQGADSVVVFPMNIKPFTLLYKLYERGYVNPVSQWMLIDLLGEIPPKYLDNVSLSWYGDRKNFYENDEFPLIPPQDCVECHDILFKTYADFMKGDSINKRAEIIQSVKNKKKLCMCGKRYELQMRSWSKRKTPYQIYEILHKIDD